MSKGRPTRYGDTTITADAPYAKLTTGGETVETGKRGDFNENSRNFRKEPVRYVEATESTPEVVSRTGIHARTIPVASCTDSEQSRFSLIDKHVSNTKAAVPGRRRAPDPNLPGERFQRTDRQPVRRAALPVRPVRPASRRDRAAAMARRHRLQPGAGYRAFGRGRHGSWARRSVASGSTTRRAISARATSIPSGSTSPMRWTRRRCCGPTPHGAVRRWTWTPIPGASSSSD